MTGATQIGDALAASVAALAAATSQFSTLSSSIINLASSLTAGAQPAVSAESFPVVSALTAGAQPSVSAESFPVVSAPPLEQKLATTAKAADAESAFRWAPGESERLSLRPIRHHDIWEYRKKLSALHWDSEEVSTIKDKADWKRMTSDQKHFVIMQLAFFSRIDIDVLSMIDGLLKEVDCMEAQQYYIAQAEQECTHADSYAIQIETLTEGAERDRILNAARTMPIIGQIRAWVVKWFDPQIPIGERLVAFAGIEGVLFQGSFCALQDLREKNLLPGIVKFNEFIFRDENIHTQQTALLIRKYLKVKPKQFLAHRIFRDLAENIIDPFVRESLPVRMIGMDALLMTQYVRFRVDKVLGYMEYAPLYRATNPFRFMDKLELNEVNKTNFFEGTPSEYQNPIGRGASDLLIDDTPITDGIDDN